MKKKCLIRLEHDDYKDLMHYTLFEGAMVVLSRYDSEKVQYVKKHGSFFVSKDIHSEKFEKIRVSIIQDKETVQLVYDEMIKQDNAYFKDGIEGLCVLKFEK